MKKTCKTYAPEDISRFVDNELSQDLYLEMAQHHQNCRECRNRAYQYHSLSAVFSGHADKEISKIDLGCLEQKVELLIQDRGHKSWGMGFGIPGKNIYLKLASIAAILLISLFAFQGGLGNRTKDPSAIVKSVKTDGGSIMIIETQKEKHTIIWFSET